jgi:hypothetical protein
MTTLIERALLALLAIAVSALTGWTVRGWKDDSEELKDVKKTQAVVDAFREHEAKVAGVLEQRLQQLRANQTIVEREREKVVDRPVYRNVCLDADGLRLIEQARTGATAASQPARSLP